VLHVLLSSDIVAETLITPPAQTHDGHHALFALGCAQYFLHFFRILKKGDVQPKGEQQAAEGTIPCHIKVLSNAGRHTGQFCKPGSKIQYAKLGLQAAITLCSGLQSWTDFTAALTSI
jgi:hypothetical protein